MKNTLLIISLILVLLIGSLARLSLLGWLFFVGYGTVFIFGAIHIIVNLQLIRSSAFLRTKDLIFISIFHLLFLGLFFFQSDADDSRGYIVLEHIFGDLSWIETEETSWFGFFICLVLYLILIPILLYRIKRVDQNISSNRIKTISVLIIGILVLPVALLFGFSYISHRQDSSEDESIGRYESLRSALKNKNHVKYLRLYDYPDSYTEIPSEVFTLTELEELEMYSNEIREIPRGIATLSKIKVLDLQYNQIKTIPNEIAYLKKLEHLILINNLIDSINPKLCECTGLKVLSIGGPSLRHIPICLSQMPRLEKLVVQSDSINYFMDEFKKFTNLKQLDLYTYENEIRNNKKYKEVKDALPKTKISIP